MPVVQRITSQTYNVLLFNGRDTFLSAPNNFSFLINNGFTIDFWMNPSDVSATPCICGLNNMYSNFPISIQLNEDNISFSFNGQILKILIKPYLHSWNHFAFLYDNINNRIGGVINGKLIEVLSVNIQNFQPLNSLKIGTADNQSFYNGYVCLFRLWSKFEGLVEISKLFNSYFEEKTENLSIELELVNGFNSEAILGGGSWFTLQSQNNPSFNISGSVTWNSLNNLPFYLNLSSRVLEVPSSNVWGFNVESGFTDKTTDFSIEFWICALSLADRQLLIIPATKYFPGLSIKLISEGGFFSLNLIIGNQSGNTKRIGWDYDWHHFAFTFKSENQELTIYRDLELYETIPLWLPSTANSIQTSSINLFYPGNLILQFSELRIWNICLTLAQIKQFSSVRISSGEQNLLRYYPFSGNTNSFLNNGAGIGNISYMGGANPALKLTQPQNGPFSTAFFKNCYQFSGGNNYLSFQSYEVYNLENFSVSFWVSRTRFNVSEIIFDSVPVKIAFTATNEIAVWIQNDYNPYVFPVPYANKMWHNWTFALSTRPGAFACFLDGDMVYSKPINNQLTFNNFAIGAGFNGSEKFIGAMAYISIWNTNLKQGEIISYGSKRLSGLEPGLLHYYTFDNFENNTVKDECGRKNLAGIDSGLVTQMNKILKNFTGVTGMFKRSAKKILNQKYLEEIKNAKIAIENAQKEHDYKIKDIFTKIESKINAPIVDFIIQRPGENDITFFQSNKKYNYNIQLPKTNFASIPFLDPVSGISSLVEPYYKTVVPANPSFARINGNSFNHLLSIGKKDFSIYFYVRFNNPQQKNYLTIIGENQPGMGFLITYNDDATISVQVADQTIKSTPFEKTTDWQFITITYQAFSGYISFYQNSIPKGTGTLPRAILDIDVFVHTIRFGLGWDNSNSFSGHLAGMYIFDTPDLCNYPNIYAVKRFVEGETIFIKYSPVAIWVFNVRKGEYPYMWIRTVGLYYLFYSFSAEGGDFGPSPKILPPFCEYAIQFTGYDSYIDLGTMVVTDNKSFGLSLKIKAAKLNRKGYIFNSLNSNQESQCCIYIDENNNIKFTYLGQTAVIESSKYSDGWNQWDFLLHGERGELKVYINNVIIHQQGFSIAQSLSSGKVFLGCEKNGSSQGFIGYISAYRLYKNSIYQYESYPSFTTCIAGLIANGVCISAIINRSPDSELQNNQILDPMRGVFCNMNRCNSTNYNIGQAITLKERDENGNFKESIIPYEGKIDITNTIDSYTTINFQDIGNKTTYFGFIGNSIHIIDPSRISYKPFPLLSFWKIDSAFNKIYSNNSNFYLTLNRACISMNLSGGVLINEAKYIPEIKLDNTILTEALQTSVFAQDNKLFLVSYSSYIVNRLELKTNIIGLCSNTNKSILYIYLESGEIYSYFFNTNLLIQEATGPASQLRAQLLIIDSQFRADEKIKMRLLKRKDQLLALNKQLAITKAKYLSQLEQTISQQQVEEDKVDTYLQQQNERIQQQTAVEQKNIAAQIKAYQDNIEALAQERRQAKMEIDQDLKKSISEIQNAYAALQAKANKINSIANYLMKTYPTQYINLTAQEREILNNN